MRSSHKSLFFDTQADGASFPALVQAMAGMKPGEARDFALAFPLDWDKEELRGMNAQWRVALSELFVRTTPEASDELAPRLVPGCVTLAAVRAHFAAAAKEGLKKAEGEARREALLLALCEACEVDVPRSLFEEQGRQSYSARLLEMQGRGQLSGAPPDQ